MDKYYTPDISEFHVGFEFEFNGVDCNWKHYEWQKSKIVTNKESSFQMDTLRWVDDIFTPNNVVNENLSEFIRVKYLNQDDIESLGWVFFGNPQNDLPNYVFTIRSKTEFEKKQMSIEPDKGILLFVLDFKPHIDEVEISDCKIGMPVFRGKIKNKSELRRVMQQLSIT